LGNKKGQTRLVDATAADRIVLFELIPTIPILGKEKRQTRLAETTEKKITGLFFGKDENRKCYLDFISPHTIHEIVPLWEYL